MSTRFNIDTCAVLVEFNASMWTARKLDRTATQEVVASKNARSAQAARVNKNLLAGRNELDIIQTHLNAARDYVYTQTLPWSNNGLRLLPSAKFIAFNDKMGEFEQRMFDLVSDFVKVYPSLITAQAMELGDLFDRAEYPTAEQITDKFSFRVTYMPVPSSGDFRIDIGNQARKELQDRLDRVAQERIESAMQDAKSRITAHLDRLMTQLRAETTSANGKTRKPKLYDSLLEGGIELCDALDALNLVRDPDVDSVRIALKRLLSQFDIDDLRKSDAARTELRTQVEDIRNRFDF